MTIKAPNRVLYVLMLLLLCPWQAQANSVADQAKQELALGRIDAASDLLRKQVQSVPDDYQAWFLLGVAHARSQRYHQAIEAFRRVIELHADLAEPHNNLAVIYNELGDVKAAIQELEKSLQKHPGYAVAEENIGDLYVKLALQYYQKALQEKDDHALRLRYTRLLHVRDPRSGESINQEPQRVTLKKEPVKGQNKVITPDVDLKAEVLEDVAKSVVNQRDAVLAAIENWRTAWQSQNLKDYFSAYADDYVPTSKHASLAAWKIYKQRVITHKKYIKVHLSDLSIVFSENNKTAQIRFKQQFQSDTYNGNNVKVLKLEQRQNTWKIISEISISS
ncbi:MAG: tetratricopeptide repeat protein [Mariprofundaceae bacterium]|nr:tetratricopeptide repeat protein [Mariprofundaceae bacterium]